MSSSVYSFNIYSQKSRFKRAGNGKKPCSNRKVNKSRTGDSNSEHESSSDCATVSSVSSIASTYESEKLSADKRHVEQFFQALNDAVEKSSHLRVLGLQSICQILTHHYMPDFVETHKDILIGFVKKAICRGQAPEKVWAAHLVPLVILQLGDVTQFSKELNKRLCITVQDKVVSLDARAKCCRALGLLNFLGGDGIGELLTFMQYFESIFDGTRLRADDKESFELQAAALSSWGLLLTLIPGEDFVSHTINGHPPCEWTAIEKVVALLQSPYLDVRIAAGKTLALIFECGRSYGKQFLNEGLRAVIETVKNLATVSNKYRAKRDLKVQHAVFRDILRYLQEDTVPETIVRFGTESLVLDSWAICHQYAQLRAVLGPGMTSHLQKNNLIRDMFELGIKPANVSYNEGKLSKTERQLMNATASKKRTISRGRQRDELYVNLDY